VGQKERDVADWTTDAVDTLERVVRVVRDKTVVPAQKATKAVVYGLLAAFLVVTASFMLALAIFRALVVLTGDVWLAYLVLGGIFVIAGGFLWTRRTRKTRDEEAHV